MECRDEWVGGRLLFHPLKVMWKRGGCAVADRSCGLAVVKSAGLVKGCHFEKLNIPLEISSVF
jgi:hypothetical protein